MKKKWIIAIVAIVAVLLLASYGTSVLANKKKISPVISNVYTDPVDVKPGDEMLVSADVRDRAKAGIKSVQAFMPHEAGEDVLDLNLVSGDKFKGTWQVVWDVHDTLQKGYTTIIRAENENGIISEKDIYWNNVVILNAATGLSCDDLCVTRGYNSCVSAGNDAGGTNSYWWGWRTELGGRCEDLGPMFGDPCEFIIWSSGYTCEGNATMWTNCLCAGEGPDTCTAPSSGDWEVDLADNCWIDSETYVNGTIYFYGQGTFQCTSENPTIVSEKIVIAHEANNGLFQNCTMLIRDLD